MSQHVFYSSEDEYLAHSLKGLARKFHKYLLRIKNGDKYRYFYSQKEIDDYYKKGNSNGSEKPTDKFHSRDKKVNDAAAIEPDLASEKSNKAFDEKRKNMHPDEKGNRNPQRQEYLEQANKVYQAAERSALEAKSAMNDAKRQYEAALEKGNKRKIEAASKKYESAKTKYQTERAVADKAHDYWYNIYNSLWD